MLPRIIKQDGSREPFDEEKLRSGLLRALEKRPVSVESIELKSIRSNIAFARRVSARCSSSGGRKGHGVAEGARPCCLCALCFGLQKFSGSGGVRDAIESLEAEPSQEPEAERVRKAPWSATTTRVDGTRDHAGRKARYWSRRIRQWAVSCCEMASFSARGHQPGQRSCRNHGASSARDAHGPEGVAGATAFVTASHAATKGGQAPRGGVD